MEQLTEDQLNRLSDDEIRTLYAGIQAMWRTPAGNQLIRRSIAEIRAGRFESQQHPRPVRATKAFVEALENDPDLEANS